MQKLTNEVIALHSGYLSYCSTKLALIVAGFLTVLSVGACSSPNLNSEKPVSRFIAAPDGSFLQRTSREFIAKDSAKSVMAPLTDGNQALGSRLRLIEQAETSIDLQYFLGKPDLAGALLAEALLRAADRGVRVRFILDDVFTSVADDGLMLLDQHPNIEVRIFNPTRRPFHKMIGYLTEFRRVNRRMHNKTFTVDGAFSIIGGRNVADEYYQLNADTEFADFDLIMSGPVVEEIGKAFDLYWNDGWSVPLGQLSKPLTSSEFEDNRAELTARLKPARSTYEKAYYDPYLVKLRRGEMPIFSGKTKVVTDRPEKLKAPVREGQRDVAEALLRKMQNANSDILLLTPYFVPEDYGAKFFSELAKRGVRVRIVTNSLAATNHAYVHAGYRRHRASLLEDGVELYEVRADSLQALGLVPADSNTGLVMHTKLAVIDQTELFVGSLNFDPRSIKQNTEFGVFIHSPELVKGVVPHPDENLAKFTYRVMLRSDGDIEWHYSGAGKTSITRNEPGASFLKLLVVGISALLPIEGQL